MIYHPGNREVSLWKFLYRLLEAPSHPNYQLIRWVNKGEYAFRVYDTAGLALRWGLEKNNIHMNYDKMCRAMRQYKHGEVQKVPGTKLTFKFGDVVVNEIKKGKL